ncbi:MAG TPA: MFS transporter [Bradyrhizobium sp.]|uniref:MFS transporter n=1 Tax=Bradyrhizobium sp. TaxID=376 RepID=UPI002C63C823|nr:MFS transporter [Bradyrhizobium sp.]HLZ00689.1 MFS transporter [Bradyrhizobium sp.]
MTSADTSRLDRPQRHIELSRTAATAAVAVLIGVLFAGSTAVTPLYIMYKQAFGFSQITLTLIYAVYVVGNLGGLLLLGRLSDQVGRRPVAAASIALAIISALVFLFARGVGALYLGRILSGLAISIGVGTGTAWLAELIDDESKSRATVIATSANFIGLGVSALIAGLLAEYLPWPLHLTYIVYLLALFAAATAVLMAPETVTRSRPSLPLSIRPRVSVPPQIRAQFVAPAVTGFGSLALVGFYAALAPSLLADQLHVTNHAVAGAIFLEMAVFVAGAIVATRSLSSRASMLLALALMPPSVALIVAAQLAASMALLIIATAVCAVTAGLGYRGSLQVTNQIAPPNQRAETVSSYLICGFAGNALPVIGIGVISTLAGANAASLAFAATIIVFAVIALYFGMRQPPKGE